MLSKMVLLNIGHAILLQPSITPAWQKNLGSLPEESGSKRAGSGRLCELSTAFPAETPLKDFSRSWPAFHLLKQLPSPPSGLPKRLLSEVPSGPVKKTFYPTVQTSSPFLASLLSPLLLMKYKDGLLPGYVPLNCHFPEQRPIHKSHSGTIVWIHLTASSSKQAFMYEQGKGPPALLVNISQVGSVQQPPPPPPHPTRHLSAIRMPWPCRNSHS